MPVEQGKIVGGFTVTYNAVTKEWAVVVTADGVAPVIVRRGLSQTHACNLANNLNVLLSTHMTNPHCRFCGGIGGCHNCDS